MLKNARVLRKQAGAWARGGPVLGLWLAASLALAAKGMSQYAGTLQFSTNNYTTVESAGYVTIAVVRSNATMDSVTVAYTTSNGTAVAGIDYLDKSGILVFDSF